MDAAEQQAHYDRTHDPARVLALSDGVFAIILTLLVLEIHVPELSEGQSLRNALEEIRPSFSAFLISFIVVAIAWAGHRDIFALIQRTDRILVWLNIIYLLPLSILPFGASLLARYETEAVALRLYGFMLAAIVVTRLWVWVYVNKKPHLLFAPIDDRSFRAGLSLGLVPCVAYGIAIGTAEAWPRVSIWIYALVPILYFIGVTRSRTGAPPGSAEEDFT